MSTFDDLNYRWRETYFVFFRSLGRPTVVGLEKAFRRQKRQLELSQLKGDDDGRLESVTVVAPQAYAAIDIVYVAGEEVAEQLKTLLRDLRAVAETADERGKLDKLSECDSRLDVLHFEQIVDAQRTEEDEFDEVLDPGALLLVIERLTRLCDGVAVDPAASAVM